MDSQMLLGELKAFRRQTEIDMKEMKDDIKTLMAFRWKIISVSSFVSLLVTLAVEFLRH